MATEIGYTSVWRARTRPSALNVLLIYQTQMPGPLSPMFSKHIHIQTAHTKQNIVDAVHKSKHYIVKITPTFYQNMFTEIFCIMLTLKTSNGTGGAWGLGGVDDDDDDGRMDESSASNGMEQRSERCLISRAKTDSMRLVSRERGQVRLFLRSDNVCLIFRRVRAYVFAAF